MADLIEIYHEYPFLADLNKHDVTKLFIKLALTDDDKEMAMACSNILKRHEIEIESARQKFLKQQ